MKQLKRLGLFDINEKFIRRIFLRWRWTCKKPIKRQLQKYSVVNIQRYLHYIVDILGIKMSRLKFADECHFVPKDLQNNYGYTEIGEPLIVLTNTKLDASYSLTLLTRLPDVDQDLIFVDLREKSNTSWDFVSFVILALEKKVLVADDYFIIDNASVHAADDSFEVAISLLNTAGVHLVYLPAYSPKLNPCELVFHYLKTVSQQQINITASMML